MKINVHLIVVLLISILLVQCTGSKNTVSESQPMQQVGGNMPSWVKSRPIDDQYYTGIAVASKSANPTSYALAAQRNAINEMASQIEVNVKSNSMLFSFEDNNAYRDEYKEFIQVKANQDVSNYEEVASWENDYEFWVYYRLSKEQFQKDKQLKINQAISLSKDALKRAEYLENKGDVVTAMKEYFVALNPIKPYLGEPLSTTYELDSVYLGNFLFDKISGIAQKIEIAPANALVESVWGGKLSSLELKFIVTDSASIALKEVPVSFTYSEGIIRPREDVSNQNGEVFTEVNKISSTNRLQEVQAEVSFEKMIVGDQRVDEVTQLVLNKLHNPTASINVKVSAPSIYVESSEKTFLKPKGTSLKQAFLSKASQMGFEIVDSEKEADIIVAIEADTKESGITSELHNSYLNGSVSIRDKQSNALLYQENLNNIKGVSSNYDLASEQAYIKAVEIIREKIVPRFFRKYLS